MNKLIKLALNWRYWALILIALVAVAGIFSDTTEFEGENGIGAFLAIKGAGFAALGVFNILFLKWARAGKINELAGLIEEE